MTPSEYGEAASSKSHWGHGHKPSLDQEKATPLEAAYIDIHEDAPDKLDEVHLRLLRLKRLGRIRHARYKAWVGGHGLIYLPLEDAWMHEHTLTLDANKKVWAQQTGLEVVDKLLKDCHIEHYVDVSEEALRPEDSGTIYTQYMDASHIRPADGKYGPCSKTLDALEEARGLDQEVKRHGPYSNEQRHRAYSKNPHGPSKPHGSKQIHGPNQFVKYNPCLKTSPCQLGLPIAHGVFGPSQPTRILLRPPDGAKPKQEA